MALALELMRDLHWRPIVTAPRDGTPILLALPHRPDDPAKGGYSFDVAAWDDEDRKGWRGEDSLWQPDLPTHWMPLPDPPEAK